jgi:hypothetical protein
MTVESHAATSNSGRYREDRDEGYEPEDGGPEGTIHVDRGNRNSAALSAAHTAAFEREDKARRGGIDRWIEAGDDVRRAEALCRMYSRRILRAHLRPPMRLRVARVRRGAGERRRGSRPRAVRVNADAASKDPPPEPPPRPGAPPTGGREQAAGIGGAA